MALQSYTRLSSQVFALESPLYSLAGDEKTQDPTTIVLFGWGDGLPRHLAKYSEQYREMYPRSRIVVVLSPIFKSTFSTFSQRTQSMLQVVKAATEKQANTSGTGQFSQMNDRLLIHCFSNMGAVNWVATLYAYKEWRAGAAWTKPIMNNIRVPMCKTFPHALVVFDSTPGGYNFFENAGQWAYAMSLRLAPFFPWAVIMIRWICMGLLGAIHFLSWISGSLSIAEHTWKSLLDPRISTITATRLYIASKSDDIIHWEHVIENMVCAQKNGFDARAKLFEKSPHVGHMKHYPDIYWAEIRKAWEAAMRKFDR